MGWHSVVRVEFSEKGHLGLVCVYETYIQTLQNLNISIQHMCQCLLINHMESYVPILWMRMLHQYQKTPFKELLRSIDCHESLLQVARFAVTLVQPQSLFSNSYRSIAQPTEDPHTLPKTNMKPEHHLFETEHHLPSTFTFGFMLLFGEAYENYYHVYLMIHLPFIQVLNRSGLVFHDDTWHLAKVEKKQFLWRNHASLWGKPIWVCKFV